MSKPVKVNGLLSMRLDVVDQSGNSINPLTSSTLEPTAVLYVENISGSTRSVKFVNILPNGTTWMEFSGSTALGRWEDEIGNIPKSTTRESRCALAHKTGTAKNQPIQCDEVYQVPGPPPTAGSIRQWTQETNNVPFDHAIDVDP